MKFKWWMLCAALAFSGCVDASDDDDDAVDSGIAGQGGGEAGQGGGEAGQGGGEAGEGGGEAGEGGGEAGQGGGEAGQGGGEAGQGGEGGSAGEGGEGGSSIICDEAPSCNWCNGNQKLDDNGCISGYVCENGIDPCTTDPCETKDDCGAGKDCNTETGLCWPVQCNTLACNWCNGQATLDDDGCAVSYTCANGVDPCATDPCTTNNDCGDNQECDTNTGLCWAKSCNVTIRFEGDASGGIAIAGEFNNWSTSSHMLQSVNGGYEITLNERDGLQRGKLYAYKFVKGGNDWFLDPNNTHRKYVGDTLNSAFLFPNCGLPTVKMDTIQTNYVENGGTYSATVHVSANVDGNNIASVVAKLDNQTVTATSSNDGTYVYSGNVAAGRHVLSVTATDSEGNVSEPVESIFWMEAEAFNWRDTALYLLFTDRFANGDRSNDAPVGDGVPAIADWHGGDLQGAKAVLESGYFDNLGVRAIWLSPVNAQVSGHFQESGGDHQIAPYHGYWPISGRSVEEHLGGGAALKEFVDAAHQRGIRVLLDLINNQIHEQHEYYASNPEWFRTGCVCGTAGCGWSEKPLECLFTTYLPDINWRVPEAEAQFTNDALYWVSNYGVDGFRVDAVKHVETNSIYNMRAEITRRFEQGGTRVVMIGETAVGQGDSWHNDGLNFNDGYAWIEGYVGKNALDGQFDFPTYHRLNNGGLMNDTISYQTVDEIISDIETKYSPDALHVGFLGSHDTSRMASRAAGDPNVGCKWDDICDTMPGNFEDYGTLYRLMSMWTLLMSMPVIPLIYNGDEIALPGGEDPDNRRDMIFDPTLGSDISALSIASTELTSMQISLRSWIQGLAQVRKSHHAMTRGARMELYKSQDRYVFARYDENEIVVVSINRGDAFENESIYLDRITGEQWHATDLRIENVLGSGTGRIESSDNGFIMKLRMPVHSDSIFVITRR